MIFDTFFFLDTHIALYVIRDGIKKRRSHVKSMERVKISRNDDV